MNPLHLSPTFRSPRRARRVLTAFVASGLTLTALAACGSDDDGSAKLSQAACDSAVDFGVAFSQAPREPDQFSGYAKETLVPIGKAMEAGFTKGDEARAAKTLSDAFGRIAESGDPSVLEEAPVAKAQTTLGKAVHDDCDLQSVDITAKEYLFENAPDTLKAGRVSFALTNKGVEDHEMVLFKRAADATENIDEVLALPEEEQMAKIAFTGVTFGGPESTNYVALDLEPGTYFLLCFLPQGGGEDGPPHFMAGMKHTLTVS